LVVFEVNGSMVDIKVGRKDREQVVLNLSMFCFELMSGITGGLRDSTCWLLDLSSLERIEQTFQYLA
jgi:hypothetical protein